MTERWFIYAPIDGWLTYLTRGWRLGFVAQPAIHHHGHWSVLLEREDAP